MTPVNVWNLIDRWRQCRYSSITLWRVMHKEGKKGISDSYGITLYGGYAKRQIVIWCHWPMVVLNTRFPSQNWRMRIPNHKKKQDINSYFIKNICSIIILVFLIHIIHRYFLNDINLAFAFDWFVKNKIMTGYK